MKDLRCAQCRLTNINLSPLTKLRSLDVSYSAFSDTALAGLAGMKELRRLNLRDTMVTDEGLKHLAGLTRLEELDLSGTRITDRGIEFPEAPFPPPGREPANRRALAGVSVDWRGRAAARSRRAGPQAAGARGTRLSGTDEPNPIEHGRSAGASGLRAGPP